VQLSGLPVVVQDSNVEFVGKVIDVGEAEIDTDIGATEVTITLALAGALEPPTFEQVRVYVYVFATDSTP
jgi:hypothetical protein